MSIRISGKPIVELPFRTMLRRTGGNSYERRWWGVATAVRSHQTPAPFDEERVDQQEGSAIAIKTVQYTGKPTDQNGTTEEEAVETMTIRFADTNFILAQNPSFIEITPADILALNAGVAEKTPFNSITLEATGDITDELEYYQCRSIGIDSYRAKLPIVTWNRTVSANFGAELDLAGVGAIWSTADAAEAMGTPVLFDIPVGNVGIDIGTLDSYTMGWLKDADLDYNGEGKILMKVSFEYGLWRDSVYPSHA